MSVRGGPPCRVLTSNLSMKSLMAALSPVRRLGGASISSLCVRDVRL